MNPSDEKFMSIALTLALRGRGYVEPNPMVGAVIVRDGKEIARGWHRRFGGPHAEIDAMNAARASGAAVTGATVYVSLEPCCHHGKTPPCTEALIGAKVARVVVAMPDPDTRVSGKGADRLREAGIDVTVGVCQPQARELLAPYITLRTKKRPWVICKWAQTSDGFIARRPDKGRWISGEQSREYVHELRGQCDGILVGVGTVLADGPMLTNRGGVGRQPTRVILDSSLRTPTDSKLAQTARNSPVLLLTTQSGITQRPKAAEALRHAGVEVLPLPAGMGGVDIPAALAELGRRDWTYLLVEGGAAVLENVVCGGHADELLAFVSPDDVGEEAVGLPWFDVAALRDSLGLPQPEISNIGDDAVYRFVLNRP